MTLRGLIAALAIWLGLAVPALAADDQGQRIEVGHVQAAGLPEQRLTIWLPPGYATSKRRYGVVYMHDGHNLFDLTKSNFNKIWAADKAMLAASRKGRFAPYIIVGIWAPGADRYRQYLPKDIYDLASPAQRERMDKLTGGPVISDAYLAWLAGPLKHWVDKTYRTKPGRMDTVIAGSSMGGLMSCYAFLRRPDVYGRAACVSSHWPAAEPGAPGAFDADLVARWDGWFKQHLGKATGRRLWMDHGTATLDAWYAPYQQVIDARLAASGWKRWRDWESKVYPGAEHEENAWAARLPEIFGWLLRH